MKIKNLSLLLIGMLASFAVNAQDMKHFTLEDLNFGGTN